MLLLRRYDDNPQCNALSIADNHTIAICTIISLLHWAALSLNSTTALISIMKLNFQSDSPFCFFLEHNTIFSIDFPRSLHFFGACKFTITREHSLVGVVVEARTLYANSCVVIKYPPSRNVLSTRHSLQLNQGFETKIYFVLFLHNRLPRGTFAVHP